MVANSFCFFDKPSENIEIHKKANEKVDNVIDDLRKKYGFNVVKCVGVMTLNLDVGSKFKGKIDAKNKI